VVLREVDGGNLGFAYRNNIDVKLSKFNLNARACTLWS